MRVVALTGPKGCGKDSAAKGLLMQNTIDRRNYFHRAQFAAGVKGICRDFFGWTPEQMDDMEFKETPRSFWDSGPVLEPRWPMMDIANYMRDKYGPDVHAQRWERNALAVETKWGAEVITDLRFPDAEVPAIRRHESLIIYVHRQEAEDKLQAAKDAGDAKALNPSERFYTDLRREADIIIYNDKELHHLTNSVISVVRNRFGHWSNWAVPRQPHQITSQDIAEATHNG